MSHSGRKATKALVIGATSAIATQVIRLLAERGFELFLTGRNQARLEATAADAQTRGAPQVAWHLLDALDYKSHNEVLDEAWNTLGTVDLVLLAHGSLSDQDLCQQQTELLRRELEINGVSTTVLMEEITRRLEPQGTGTIAVISSVAGDRGRQSNYVYGAAKALVTAYASGLRNRLFRSGINVLTIKPGFVDTPMTAAFPKGPLWVTPEKVAHDIVRAFDKGKHVIYTPWYWRFIMGAIKTLPETLFIRLRL